MISPLKCVSYRIISYHVISYHIMSYHIISYHIISYHIISYHIKRRFCLCIQQYSYHVSLRSHAGVERSRGIAPFGGQDETQGFCASHGLHLGLPGCPAATFRTTFFGQSSGATGPVCRTIRKASWPWAIDSSGRRLPWDVCRLCHAVLTLCHAVPCCAMARAGEADLLLVWCCRPCSSW